MSLFMPKHVPLNWCKYDMLFTLELLVTFVQLAEEQAVECAERYRNNAETFIHDEYEYDEELEGDFAEVIETYGGLYSDTWDLETLFIHYFPSLQRRSAFLSLIGIFETELNKLCFLFKKKMQCKIDLKGLQGMGFFRACTYLEKVAEIDIAKDSTSWREIKNIQKIRNIVAHRDGSLLNDKGEQDKSVVSYIDQSEYLDGGEYIFIDQGFLTHVLGVFSEYFQLINQSIQESENA